MIFVSSLSYGQTIKRQNLPVLTLYQPPKFSRTLQLNDPTKFSSGLNSKPFLSPDLYAKQLGFFCKQEIKFDKVTKIPFRFRLGSVEGCDWLEGKGKR